MVVLLWVWRTLFAILLRLFGSGWRANFLFIMLVGLGLVNSVVHSSYPLSVVWFDCYCCWMGLMFGGVVLWLFVFWFMILDCVTWWFVNWLCRWLVVAFVFVCGC